MTDAIAQLRYLITDEVPDVRGGLERSTLEVAEGLAARGAAINLLYEQDGTFLARYRSFCTTVTQVPRLSIGPHRSMRGAAALARTMVVAARSAPQVVYINRLWHSGFGAGVASLCRAALVCHLRFPSAVRGLQARIGAPRVDRFIAVSHHLRDEYRAAGLDPERIDVVHNGVDPARYHPSSPGGRSASRARLGIPPDAYVVLFAGRLDPEKGVEVLLQAFPQLLRNCDDAWLVVAGGPNHHPTQDAGRAYEGSLRAMANPQRTRWLPFQADVAPLYHAADVVVLPTVGQEPLGRVVLEAMACGLPIVATSTGGTPEAFAADHRWLMVPPGDIRALTDRLTDLHGWSERRPRLGSELRRHVSEHFSLEQTLDGVEAAVGRALRHASGRRGLPFVRGNPQFARLPGGGDGRF